MSDLERLLKLAGREVQQVAQSPAVDREMKEAAPTNKKMVCKDCGDEMGHPTSDCENSAYDKDGDHWIEIDVDGDGDADIKVASDMAEEASPEDREKAMKRAFAKSDEPERGEERKKVSLKKAPWEESYSPGDENEEGMVSNCCGAPIMDVYQGHGRCSDCKEMASAETTEESVYEAGPEANDDAVHELVLYADNDGQLYQQSTSPIRKNLSKKFAKGAYDHDKAIVLWKYHADRAAKKYGVEHGNNDGFAIFSPADRRAAAKEFADAWQMELEAGNMEEGNEFSGALANAKKDGKKEFEVDGKKYKVKESSCGCCGNDPCDCGDGCACKESVMEAPTMDTTQLVIMMKNAGLSEETIQTKLNEWANSPADASELEQTSHGEAYEFAQNVNLSLKRYLDAQDMKVQVSEHTVENMKALYESKKNK